MSCLTLIALSNSIMVLYLLHVALQAERGLTVLCEGLPDLLVQSLKRVLVLNAHVGGLIGATKDSRRERCRARGPLKRARRERFITVQHHGGLSRSPELRRPSLVGPVTSAVPRLLSLRVHLLTPCRE